MIGKNLECLGNLCSKRYLGYVIMIDSVISFQLLASFGSNTRKLLLRPPTTPEN